MTSGMSREYPANARQTYKQDLKSLQLEIRKLWRAIKTPAEATGGCCIVPNQSDFAGVGSQSSYGGVSVGFTNTSFNFVQVALPYSFGDGEPYVEIAGDEYDDIITFRRSGMWNVTIQLTTLAVTAGTATKFVSSITPYFQSAGESYPNTIERHDYLLDSATGSFGHDTYSFMIPANPGDTLTFEGGLFITGTTFSGTQTLSMDVACTLVLAGDVPSYPGSGGG